ncbi:hypothetical protein E1301_Tti021726 [Triplophysa tibetana]|uniref:Uncharacterized protein n=1 Tax=Triplophysa tibetana TaxID=1572043 RepID=A0A5A9NBF8_9TELE|nr:hypothetical protein E1301_Tti021726 [Triplophysa tibetana]
MDSFVINTLTEWQIAQDLLVLHGDAASRLFETWLPIHAEKILCLARQEGKLTLPLDGLTPDGVGDLALRQLPAWLPPTTYKVGRGRGVKGVRHTIQECSLAFIDHKPPGINMVEYYLHEAKACKPYPHILTLGNDQSAFQVFVIIAGQALEQRNRCVHPLPVPCPLLTPGCPKRNRCVNLLPVPAPLLTPGRPKRNCCVNPYQCLLHYLPLAVRRGTAV